MMCLSDSCVKMSFGVLLGTYFCLPSLFLEFKTRFYLFIVRFFLRKQYGRPSFFDSIQKIKQTRTGFSVNQDTVEIFKGRKKVRREVHLWQNTCEKLKVFEMQ